MLGRVSSVEFVEAQYRYDVRRHVSGLFAELLVWKEAEDGRAPKKSRDHPDFPPSVMTTAGIVTPIGSDTLSQRDDPSRSGTKETSEHQAIPVLQRVSTGSSEHSEDHDGARLLAMDIIGRSPRNLSRGVHLMESTLRPTTFIGNNSWT